MSSVMEEYERAPYPAYVHPLTDPARIGAIGRLLGMQSAFPERARVLELGCSSGSNLLAMAARFPEAQFLGIDLSASAIESAKILAAEAHLENITFQQADLSEWEPGEDRFDYMIAYGLFSWVPDDVKDRLFQLCRKLLAPQGIACFSYMTYPGCKQAEAFRDLLRLRTEAAADVEEKIGIAHQTLDFLDRAYALLPEQATTGFLRQEARRIREKEPLLLIHDDLGAERDPCYLLQFANWAAEHELSYLGESEFHMMLVENLPSETTRELLAMNLDQLETEQWIDYIVNRSFRCSLLVRSEAKTEAGLAATALSDLNFAPVLKPEGRPVPAAAEGEFLDLDQNRICLRSVPLVAFIRALATFPDAFTPYGQILQTAKDEAGRGFSDDEESRLREDLLSLFGKQKLRLSLAPSRRLPASMGNPRLSPLNRVFVNRCGGVVTSFHEMKKLTPHEVAVCKLMDGSKSVGEIRASAEADRLGKKFESLLSSLNRYGCFS